LVMNLDENLMTKQVINVYSNTLNI
jgi:hypothetical protein